jgi:hypothetical protein
MAAQSTQYLSRAEIYARYYERLDAQTNMLWLGGLTEYVPSMAASNLYKMIGMVPQLEEAVGPTDPVGLTANGFEVRNKEYKAALKIPKLDLRRDQTGLLNARIGDFTRRGLSHWLKLCSTLIQNGDVGQCYTGTTFFSTTHSEGNSGTYKNLLTASEVPDLNVAVATAPTPYEMAKAILGCVLYFYSYLDDQGEPRNEMARKFLVLVPLGLAGPAMTAATKLTLDTGSGSVDNPLVNNGKFTIEVDVNPRLTWTDKFTVSITDGFLKPLIRQEEQVLETDVFGPESEHFRLNDEALIKANTLRNAAYGTPWQMVRATLS